MIYTVKNGDTIYKISNEFGVTPSSIIYANQIIPPYAITPGQTLFIDSENQSFTPKREIYTGGYAYPFISRYVLEQTLPYLSYLYIFSYGFTPSGQLIPPLLDDTWMIEAALSHGVLPILTLTPFGSDGMFNNNLITQLVNNQTAVETLKDNILTQIQNRSFKGLDIDFEFILETDKDAFSAFVKYMTDSINEAGYEVSVALAPKTSDTQPGLLYAGKDYRTLGEAANYVLLMTYEWGYTYGPPMAVAPLNKVREVVEYAVSVIPSYKIHLGIPNYGYDWPLPFLQGVTKAKTIGNIEAVQIAITNGVSISFDEIAQSPFFYYNQNNTSHEVWFENLTSLNGKFNLIKEYNLRGAGYWQIMQLYRGNWLLLKDIFDIISVNIQ